MIRKLVLRRAAHAAGLSWQGRPRTPDGSADVALLVQLLRDEGNSVITVSRGNTDLYDYSGKLDNARYSAVLHFDLASEATAFIARFAEDLPHLQGPGAASVALYSEAWGIGMNIHFNPLLAGILIRRMTRTGTFGNAVTPEHA